MRRIRQSLGAPSGGVVRTPPSLRAPDELEGSSNIVGHPLYGAYVRPPINHVSQISGTQSTQRAAEHIAYDDSGVPYKLSIVDGTLNVFNEAGVPQVISAPNGFGYLTGGDVRFVTIGLETYIVNRATVPLTPATPASPGVGQAGVTVYVRKWEPNKTYSLTVHGTTVSHTTGTSGSIVTVATALIAAINAALPTTFFALGGAGGAFGILRIGASALVPFSVSQSGPSEDAMTILTNTVQIWEDLPLEFTDGAVVSVVGNPDNDQDNYFLRFVGPSAGAYGPGSWVETTGFDVPLTLDGATWPHRFRRTPSGINFGVFERVPWAQRTVGNLITNPWPIVSGVPIQDVFQIEGRLGLLGPRGVTLSETFWPENLFRTKTADLIDSDPVNIDAPSLLGAWHSAIEWNGSLLLWSDEGQSVLDGGGQPISQRSVRLRQISSYRSDPSVKPIRDGGRIFFFLRTITGTEVWEYLFRSDGAPPLAVQITARATQVISGVPRGLATFEPLGLLLVATSNGLWIITSLEGDDRRRINPMTLPAGHSVMCLSKSELDLGLILNAPTGVSINTINLERSS